MSALPTLDPHITQSTLLRAYSDVNSDGDEDFNGMRSGKLKLKFK